MHLLFLPAVVTLTRAGIASSACSSTSDERSTSTGLRAANLLQRIVAYKSPLGKLALPPTIIHSAINLILVWFVAARSERGARTGIAAGDIESENEFSFTMSADGTAP